MVSICLRSRITRDDGKYQHHPSPQVGQVVQEIHGPESKRKEGTARMLLPAGG